MPDDPPADRPLDRFIENRAIEPLHLRHVAEACIPRDHKSPLRLIGPQLRQIDLVRRERPAFSGRLQRVFHQKPIGRPLERKARIQHDRPAVRNLAHWHLVRLAPLETPIPYDAAAPEAERKAAVQRWREMIPAGELPPHLREKK